MDNVEIVDSKASRNKKKTKNSGVVLRDSISMSARDNGDINSRHKAK
jgi:hypothetical protein